MSPEAIKAALVYPEGKNWWEWDQVLLTQFRTVDSAAAFRGLFPLAVASQDRGPASTAAWLLYKLNPSCLISCREAIGALLFDWDISIKEPVFYIAQQFGASTVQATIHEMRPGVTDNSKQTNLDTILYWLKCFEEMMNSPAPDGQV